MDESILVSIKRALGLTEEYEVFDFEIVMHINSVLSTLNQLGVGPKAGISIKDKESTWSLLLEDNQRLNNAKSYVFLRVRMLFDPPTTPHLLLAFKERIQEEEWRLQVEADPMIPQISENEVESELTIGEFNDTAPI